MKDIKYPELKVGQMVKFVDSKKDESIGLVIEFAGNKQIWYPETGEHDGGQLNGYHTEVRESSNGEPMTSLADAWEDGFVVWNRAEEEAKVDPLKWFYVEAFGAKYIVFGRKDECGQIRGTYVTLENKNGFFKISKHVGAFSDPQKVIELSSCPCHFSSQG